MQRAPAALWRQFQRTLLRGPPAKSATFAGYSVPIHGQRKSDRLLGRFGSGLARHPLAASQQHTAGERATSGRDEAHFGMAGDLSLACLAPELNTGFPQEAEAVQAAR
jgi:hypothetical protein